MLGLRLTATSHPAAWAAFAGVLAMAGLPIYIYAPKFYVDSYGVSLTALGAVLFALRLVDFVQDPFLGWLSEMTAPIRAGAVAVGAALMVLGMIGLFAIEPPIAPLLWFALALTLLFSAFSFLSITFYAQGVAKAQALGPKGHVRLAAWRESGALLGVCLATAAPAVLAFGPNPPFEAFAVLFAAAVLTALWLMRGEWTAVPIRTRGFDAFRAVLADRVARRLVALAFLNAAPVAITSTLFLFFVESRLAAPGWEGPLLLLFFLAAALASPFWAKLARLYGEKKIASLGMALAIGAFSGAVVLGPGDLVWFALICLASGAALGADVTLLSALFAGRLAVVLPEGAAGFALWSFVSKATLALAAATVLPLLEAFGFAGPQSPEPALHALTLLYAALPCALKVIALAVLITTPFEAKNLELSQNA